MQLTECSRSPGGIDHFQPVEGTGGFGSRHHELSGIWHIGELLRFRYAISGDGECARESLARGLRVMLGGQPRHAGEVLVYSNREAIRC